MILSCFLVWLGTERPGLLREGSAETLLGRQFTVSQRLLLGRELSDAAQLGSSHQAPWHPWTN